MLWRRCSGVWGDDVLGIDVEWYRCRGDFVEVDEVCNKSFFEVEKDSKK